MRGSRTGPVGPPTRSSRFLDVVSPAFSTGSVLFPDRVISIPPSCSCRFAVRTLSVSRQRPVRFADGLPSSPACSRGRNDGTRSRFPTGSLLFCDGVCPCLPNASRPPRGLASTTLVAWIHIAFATFCTGLQCFTLFLQCCYTGLHCFYIIFALS